MVQRRDTIRETSRELTGRNAALNTSRASPLTLCAHKLAFDGGSERLKASIVIGGDFVGNIIVALIAIFVTLIWAADQGTIQYKM